MNTQNEPAPDAPEDSEEYWILLTAIQQSMSRRWPRRTKSGLQKQLEHVADVTDEVNLLAAELMCLAGIEEGEVRLMVRQNFKARGRSFPRRRSGSSVSPRQGFNS